MKNKFLYLLSFLLLAIQTRSQSRTIELNNCNASFFNGNLYGFGLLPGKEKKGIMIYNYDHDLKPLDSLLLSKIKREPGSYLRLYSDTVHNYLNIYLQSIENKNVRVLRIDRNFKLVADIENIEIARLNNSAMFSVEAFYYKNYVYDIKTQSDSTGRQFYLNKHELKSVTENFDYILSWQFAFERKNIQSAHIFHADQRFVLLYVSVNGGNNNGEWILKINSLSGKLIKATRISEKEESFNYYFGNFLSDKTNGNIIIFGQKIPKQGSKPMGEHINLFVLEMDSLGNKLDKQDLKIPLNENKKPGQKNNSAFITRIRKAERTTDGTFKLETDLFIKNTECYRYCNTAMIKVIRTEEEMLKPDKTILSPNTLIEQYYSRDKLDMNGKLCIDSSGTFEKLYYASIPLNIQLDFKTDASNNPAWILTRSDLKKNNINFSYLIPQNKLYVLKTIEDVPKIKEPSFIKMAYNKFVVTYEAEQGKYLLKLFSW